MLFKHQFRNPKAFTSVCTLLHIRKKKKFTIFDHFVGREHDATLLFLKQVAKNSS